MTSPKKTLTERDELKVIINDNPNYSNEWHLAKGQIKDVKISLNGVDLFEQEREKGAELKEKEILDFLKKRIELEYEDTYEDMMEGKSVSFRDWKDRILSIIEDKQKPGQGNNSQVKKDNSDSPNESYLETQNNTGEDNKSGQMPVIADNQPDTSSSAESSMESLGDFSNKALKSAEPPRRLKFLCTCSEKKPCSHERKIRGGQK